MKASRLHQHTAYKGLAKPALRMLNGFLTFYYGPLNFSCYDADSAPGSGLLSIPRGILLVGPTSHIWTSLPGAPRGWARGVSGPS